MNSLLQLLVRLAKAGHQAHRTLPLPSLLSLGLAGFAFPSVCVLLMTA
jgi:hypothetical protein